MPRFFVEACSLWETTDNKRFIKHLGELRNIVIRVLIWGFRPGVDHLWSREKGGAWK